MKITFLKDYMKESFNILKLALNCYFLIQELTTSKKCEKKSNPRLDFK